MALGSSSLGSMKAIGGVRRRVLRVGLDFSPFFLRILVHSSHEDAQTSRSGYDGGAWPYGPVSSSMGAVCHTTLLATNEL